MSDLRFLRAWRIYVVAALVFNAGMLVVDAVTGNPIVVLPIICVTFLVGALVLMTRVIGRRAEQLRPRPDYAAIARMERDVYGETFQHDGSPHWASSQRDRSHDDALIHSGAIVHLGGTIILPSGEKITGAEWARRGGRTL